MYVGVSPPQKLEFSVSPVNFSARPALGPAENLGFSHSDGCMAQGSVLRVIFLIIE